MSIIDNISGNGTTAFSFEVLPPLKGNSIDKVFKTIDTLREFDPKYINITTHRSDISYKEIKSGLFQKVNERLRPGTVAIAAAIQHKYQIPAVPHIICSGFTRSETEYALIDLDFLGIHDILVLRGDKGRLDKNFTPTESGHTHAIDLQHQVNDFNKGLFLDGSIREQSSQIAYGVAGYPEKHEEAPNIQSDLHWLKQKVDSGASYIVTQMFFDNEKYFSFVDKCREEGIQVPIIPGIKPINLLDQLTVLPKIFHVDFPDDLVKALQQCKNNDDAKEVGVEWCTMQAKELKAKGVPSIHFYSLMATQSVKRVAEKIY